MKFSINSRVFTHIASSSNSFSAEGVSFIFKKCDAACLGFVVPKSLGLASLRNRFKRRCRAILEARSSDPAFPVVGIIVKPNNVGLRFNAINQSFGALFGEIINKYGQGGN